MGNEFAQGGWIVWASADSAPMLPRSVVLCPSREAAAGNLAALALEAKMAGGDVQAVEEGIRVQDPNTGQWGTVRMCGVHPEVWDDLVSRLWLNVRDAHFSPSMLDGFDLQVRLPSSDEVAAEMAAAMIGGSGLKIDLFGGEGLDDGEDLQEGQTDES